MELRLGFLCVSFPTALSPILMYLCNYLSTLEEGNGNLSHTLLSFSLFANITMKETFLWLAAMHPYIGPSSGYRTIAPTMKWAD